MEIRKAEEKDWKGIYRFLSEIVTKGETYAINHDAGEEELKHLWLKKPEACFVAMLDGRLAGSYYLKKNQQGGGSHVCNAGYIVDPEFRGRGLARKMCAHSIESALEMGFEAMQYNFVVSTNVGAIHLWKSMGFQIVGTLPGAFRHPEQGPVVALIMYRFL